MNGVDTNVLVRFLVGEDTAQANKVYKLLKNVEKNKDKLYVPVIVFIELIWVLESVYSIERLELLSLLNDLILMPIFIFENLVAIQKILQEAQKSKYDLSDLLIAETACLYGCKSVYTFDKKASKHSVFELVV